MEEVGRRVAEQINRPEGPFSAQAVQQWELGKKAKGLVIPVEPDLDTLIAFAMIVDCDLIWLLKGIEPEGREGQAAPTRGRVVAIITAEQAARTPIDYASNDTMHTQVECSKRSFAFTVFDRSNEPEFHVGDRVVLDPAGRKEPGAMVLAVVGGEPVFARYVNPQKRGKNWTCTLQALNRAWGSKHASSRDGDRIVGVMVDHAKPGSHPRHTSQ
jgi:SOS-response transcriptional repressor LexA